MDLFNLKGKVAVVTGASSGLGVQFSKALARQGTDVAIVARRTDKLAKVKKEVENFGVRCLPVKCDVTNVDDIKSAVASIQEHFGKINILVNNAGVAYFAPAEKQSDEQWLKTIATNLNGVYFFTREVGKLMIERKYGKIINMAPYTAMSQ